MNKESFLPVQSHSSFLQFNLVHELIFLFQFNQGQAMRETDRFMRKSSDEGRAGVGSVQSLVYSSRKDQRVNEQIFLSFLKSEEEKERKETVTDRFRCRSERRLRFRS